MWSKYAILQPTSIIPTPFPHPFNIIRSHRAIFHLHTVGKATRSWTPHNFKAVFVSRKVVSGKPLSKLPYVCLSLEKLVNEKHFPVKKKFNLVSRKVFFFYFGGKTLSKSCEKFRNVILFADYIKFDPQTFDCYIYFILNICFSISSIRI